MKLNCVLTLLALAGVAATSLIYGKSYIDNCALREHVAQARAETSDWQHGFAMFVAPGETPREAGPRLHEELIAGDRARNELLEQVTLLRSEIEAARKQTARVLELPEDAGKWFLTLFLDVNWDKLSDPKLRAAQLSAKALWDSNAWIVQLRQETHARIIFSTEPFALELKQGGVLDCTPCLLLQRPNGEVIWKESGGKLAKDPDALRRAIQKATRRHCPDGKCPVLLPTPDQGEPAPREEIPKAIAEPEKKAEPPQPAGHPLEGALLFGGVFAVAYLFRLRMASR